MPLSFYRGQIRPSKPKHQTSPKQVDMVEDLDNSSIVDQDEQDKCMINTPNPPSVSPPALENTNCSETSGACNVDLVATSKIKTIETTKPMNGTTGSTKGQVNKKDKPNATPSVPQKDQNRGRSQYRKGADPKQKKLTKMFSRDHSASIPRFKRINDTSPQSPLPSKSNTRSKSRQTDWFEESGDPGLC